jgi:hypothetical protein
LHRLAEIFARDLGIVAGNILGGCVGYTIAGELLPILDPDPAEAAAAVEDQQGRSRIFTLASSDEYGSRERNNVQNRIGPGVALRD